MQGVPELGRQLARGEWKPARDRNNGASGAAGTRHKALSQADTGQSSEPGRAGTKKATAWEAARMVLEDDMES